MKEYKEKYGFVAMLDVLGTRKCDISLTKKLLYRRNVVRSPVKQGRNKVALEGILNGSPRAFTFSDMITFTWELESPNVNVVRHFLAFAEWLREPVYYGLCMGIFLRGAMTVDEYIEEYTMDSTTIIGPAATDIANWYEAADWLGAIVTPSCQRRVGPVARQGFMYNGERIIPEKYFVEYDVPLKNGSKKKLWAISWPYRFWKDKMDPESELDLCFRNDLIPGIPCSKRFNSTEFFRWYGRKVYPNLNIANIEEAT